MNALAASAAVRCVVTLIEYLMLARRNARSSTVPVFQAAPVAQTFWKPERMRTAALVSAVRLAMTLVWYASTKFVAVLAATGALSALATTGVLCALATTGVLCVFSAAEAAAASRLGPATRPAAPAADALSMFRREIEGMGTPRGRWGKDRVPAFGRVSNAESTRAGVSVNIMLLAGNRCSVWPVLDLASRSCSRHASPSRSRP